MHTASLSLTLPIITGKVEAWRRFCQELSGTRLLSYITSRRKLGITRECLTLVETSMGSTAVMDLRSTDIPRTLDLLVMSQLPFDAWYRDRVQEFHGISFADHKRLVQPPPAPLRQELILEWTLTTADPDR
jgi:hypothetical protein